MTRRARSTTRRAAIAVTGLSIVALGLVLIPLPGPGTLIVMSGLNVLRREYAFAGRALDRMGAICHRSWPFKNLGSGTDSSR